MSTVSPVASGSRCRGCGKERHQVFAGAGFREHGACYRRNIDDFRVRSEDAYDNCLEIFNSMARRLPMSAPETKANTTQAPAQYDGGYHLGHGRRGPDLGREGGMNWSQMIDIIANSVVASPLIGYKAQTLKDRNFAPAFTIDQMAKDFDIALETGRAVNVPMPITAMARQFFGAMKANGKGGLDFFGLVTLMEDLAGDQP